MYHLTAPSGGVFIEEYEYKTGDCRNPFYDIRMFWTAFTIFDESLDADEFLVYQNIRKITEWQEGSDYMQAVEYSREMDESGLPTKITKHFTEKGRLW